MAAGSLVLLEMLVDNGFPEISCEEALFYAMWQMTEGIV